MKEGSGRPGVRTETLELEQQPEIPSAAVPDTMRRGVPPPDRPPESDDIPATRPLPAGRGGGAPRGAEDASGTPALNEVGPYDFPEVGRANYAVGDEFARGGLGRLMEAHDVRLDRTVALKELLSKDARAQARFIREAKITARLEHPNIVPIHEAGHWPQGPRFYTMKLVRGTTLANRLEAAASDDERLRLVPHLIDVADAVAYAHSQGILHRDLKPSNVMVGSFGETVLIDWGLAKDLRDSESDLPPSDDRMSPSVFETSDGIVVGTPPYMPPEQAMAQPLDERADVYALGAMLYHVLCGRRPYHDTHPREILAKVVKGPPIPLEEMTYDLPPDLLAIVDKAMARDPSQRYRSAEEMAEELRRFTAGRLVRAHQYSSFELLNRFVRRNLGIVMTTFFAVAGLLSLGWWSYTQIGEERDVARRNMRQAQSELQKFTLEKARVLLVSDPTEALAWLKRLPPRTPQAATAAAEADDLGVARLVLTGHTDAINRVAMTPDGVWGASVANDRTVRLWNLRDGTQTVLEGHSEKVTQVVFAPDGRTFATASHDRTVRLWAVDGGVGRVLVGHFAPIKALVFAPDGRRVAAAAEDGRVIVWRVDGTAEHVFQNPGSGRNPRIAFVPSKSPSGEVRLAVAGYAAEVRVWSLDSKDPIVLRGPRRKTEGLAVSADGSMIAAGSEDGPVHIWSRPGMRSRVLPGRPDRWTVLAFSPDGRWLTAGCLENEVRVWRTADGEAFVLDGHEERVADLMFAPSSRALLTASWDGTIRVWRDWVEEGSAGAHVLLGHANAVTSLAMSRDGLQLLSGSWDQSLRSWTVPPRLQRVLHGHSVGVHGVDFDPKNNRLVSGGHDKEVRVWDLDTASATVFGGHEDHIFRVAVSPDGRYAASSSDDRTVRLWDLDTGDFKVLRGHEADVEELVFSRDGRYLVSAGEDALAWLWSVPNGDGLRLAGHMNDVTDVAFHPDNRRIATSSRDGTVRIWRVDGRVEHVLRGAGDEAWSVTFSPDGATVAAASGDGTLRLWATDSGVEEKIYRRLAEARRARFSPDGAFIAVTTSGRTLYLCRRAFDFCDALPGHDAMVHDLAFSPDGTALVTGSGDSTVRVYDVETNESRVYRGHAAPVFDVDVSSDGQWIASGSADADVRLWPLRLPPKPEGLTTWIAGRTRKVVE